MHFYIPLLAAVACAVCNGIAAVLQKVSVDNHKRVDSLQIGLLFRLMGNMPYVLSLVLDLAGWLLLLAALHTLPLFLVQSIVAANVVVIALLERFVLHKVCGYKTYLAIFGVLIGLICLSVAARSSSVSSVDHTAWLVIVFSPLALGLIAMVLSRSKQYFAAMGLATIGGIAFGGTSIVGRILVYPHPLWKLLADPLLWALAAYGGLGLLAFMIALQRALATKVGAITVAAETIVPAVIGVMLFHDGTKSGLGPLAVAGSILVMVGCIVTALLDTPAEHPPRVIEG